MEPNAELPTGEDAIALKSSELAGTVELAMRKEMGRIRAHAVDAPSTFRTDLIAVCRQAQRKGVRAESLVIAMKSIWQSIPETRSFARPLAMDSLLNEMVTIALDEFYEPSSTSAKRVD
ncbi:MAG TPA: hypothetical protein VGO46_18225 [Gemmatimonadaceae bacterium]|jgi:hypothetical protein|nr:hypothetical protein [Gemmatimonadaceae bacterium]